MIFNIQRFSTHDGQGIRTMIFYKGCTLACNWCCNPESQSFEQSLMYDRRFCKNFRDCLKSDNNAITSDGKGISINRNAISRPENLKDICASNALIVSGEEMSVKDILFEIEKDLPFYLQSGGGVTLSGGEPLSQGSDLVILLQELSLREIDVAIETSLHVAWDMIERVIGLTKTFLVDLKHTDIEKFKRFTGGDAGLVLSNLTKLSFLHKNVIIRVPVIPEFNHSESEMRSIIDFAVSLKSVKEIHFLPFHNLGSEKYKMLDMEYMFEGKSKVGLDELTLYSEYAESAGLLSKTGG